MKGAIQGCIPWAVGDGICEISGRFTTNGSGVATLSYDYGGKMTILKSSNTYTVTLPAPWVTTVALTYSQNQSTLVACPVTFSATAGTITFTFGGAYNSGDCNFTLKFRME